MLSPGRTSEKPAKAERTMRGGFGKAGTVVERSEVFMAPCAR